MRLRHWYAAIALAPLVGISAALAGAPGDELAAPVRILAGNEPISVDIGHAAPFYGDVDGDGLADLLVGQFGEGKLRVYKNQGTAAEPKFNDFEWLQAGGDVGKIDAG